MIFVYIYTYLPRILENSMVRQNHFQIEDIVKQPMGKRKKPFQIEDIHAFVYIYTYSPTILKTRWCDEPFSNRRYCQTTDGEAEKTISNRRYS